MPCDADRSIREMWEQEELAERGFSAEEISLLEAKLDVAIAKANVKSWTNGETLPEQKRRIRKAEDAAIEEWHLEMHAKLKTGMDLINELKKVKAAYAYNND